jgi:hypothetical protein
MEKIKLTLIDVAADARKQFGEEGAEKIFGRPLPEHDWRWHIAYANGAGACTFGYQETAAHVAEYMREKGWEL